MKLSIIAIAPMVVSLWLGNPSTVEACSLSGEIHGADRESHKMALIDPNNGRWLMETNAHPDYEFYRIPRGNFLLRVYRRSRERTRAIASPRERWVSCRSNERIRNMNFSLQ